MIIKRRPMSDEHKAKISLALKGKIAGSKNPMFGKIPWNKGNGDYMTGSKNHMWKGGRIIDQYGYVCIKVGDGYPREHRIIMENKINRELSAKEVVHHMDFDKTNNEISNLHLFNSQTEHRAYHKFLRGIVAEALRGE